MGIDIGGTFTDAFLADATGAVWSAKVPSTPPEFGKGFLDAVDALGTQRGLEFGSSLADVAYICHGTTSALNALVTGDVSKVGLITTRGHRDSIFIMNLEGRYAGLEPEAIQAITATRKPPPLIPKSLAMEVTERVDCAGEVIVALDEGEAMEAIDALLGEGVEAIAISLLWSFLNPAHERRLRELVLERAPGLYVGISSELSPKIREYSRTVTTVMNAQVGPRVKAYLEPLERALVERGFTGRLLIMQGSGGSVTASEAHAAAITTIRSVLAGGVIGSKQLADQLGHRNVITTDIGGTTLLVGMIVEGEPVFTSSTVLNQFRLNVPMMDVTSIGSGGGAIAWIDPGGNLRVGPRGAGAFPGSACFGRGGREPTVTDANLVLGILNPGNFAGGLMTLDIELAREAIDRVVATPLGLSIEDAAAAIFEIQNAQTSDHVRSVVVGHGYDPRDFAMYAFGGGGPVHCHAYGSELGIREIHVPLGVSVSAFSAYGLASSDVMLSAEESRPTNFPVPATDLNRIFQALESRLAARMNAQGIAFRSVSFRREIDIKYAMQIYEVPVPVCGGDLNDGDLKRIVADFEDRYATIYGKGTGFPEAGYQFISYRVFATGEIPFDIPRHDAAKRAGDLASRVRSAPRSVLLDSRRGWEETAVYKYDELTPGDAFAGPAIVEAPTTTVVVPATARAAMHDNGNIVLSFDGEAAQ